MTTPLKAVALANVAAAIAILLFGNPAGRDSAQGAERQVDEMVLIPISPQELQAMSAQARAAAEAQKSAARPSGQRADQDHCRLPCAGDSGPAGHSAPRSPLMRIDVDRVNVRTQHLI